MRWWPFLFLFAWAPLLAQFSLDGSVGGQYKELEKRGSSPDRWKGTLPQSLIHGQLNSKYQLGKSRVQGSLFYRRVDSPLYQNSFFNREFLIFPKELVARQIFDLNHNTRGPKYRSDFLLHQLSYEHESEKWRFEIGRFYINFGQGETFNPVNPFSLPMGLFIIQNVSQASDGLRVTRFLNSDLDFTLFTLGNRRGAEKDQFKGQTVFGLLNYRNGNSQLSLTGGQDEVRGKFGGEYSYRFEESLGFIQWMYQFPKRGQAPLYDFLIGVDQQLAALWHLRIEGAYQRPEENTLIGTRFLPQEYALTVALEYEAHPLVKIRPLASIDPKSGLVYGILKGNISVTQNFEMDLFALGTLNSRPYKESFRQKLLTREVGIRGQYFF